MKTDSVQGLTAEKLAELLGMVIEGGGQGERPGPDSESAVLLQQWLAAPLPGLLETSVIGQIPADDGSSEPGGPDGPPIGQLLLDERTDLETIRRIKDCTKVLARRHGDEPTHAAAITVYYAAIASGLLHHERRITSYSYRALAEAFEKLMDKPWMPEDLWDHFARASAWAQQRSR